ncbi:MAG: hypothetical protein ACFFCT_12105 [Candidatus Odinarchaeota archaeon]
MQEYISMGNIGNDTEIIFCLTLETTPYLHTRPKYNSTGINTVRVLSEVLSFDCRYDSELQDYNCNYDIPAHKHDLLWVVKRKIYMPSSGPGYVVLNKERLWSAGGLPTIVKQLPRDAIMLPVPWIHNTWAGDGGIYNDENKHVTWKQIQAEGLYLVKDRWNINDYVWEQKTDPNYSIDHDKLCPCCRDKRSWRERGGYVPYPAECWLMRWNDSKKWYVVREADVMEMLNKFYLPEDREQALRNAKEGGMYLYSKHCHYMWLTESLFADELP